ncbi:MAG: MFS transporter [Nitrososphaeria archaeon]
MISSYVFLVFISDGITHYFEIKYLNDISNAVKCMSQETRNIALLFISRSLRSLTAGFVAIAISLYFYDVLKLSLILVGVLFTIGSFATPLISLLVGVLGDRYGRKIVLLIDLLTLPAALLIVLFTKNFCALAFASAIGGFGVAGGLVGGGVGASVGPVVTTMLAENTNDQNRTFIYSLNSVLSTFAGAAGALLVSFISFISLFWIGVFLSLLSAVVIIPVHEKYKSSRKQAKNVDRKVSENDRKFIKAFTITGLLNGLSMGLVTPYYPIIFHAFFHMSTAQVGYLMSAGGVLSGVADMFTPSLTSRMGFLRLITRTRVISATMMLLIPFSPAAYIAGLLYLIMTSLRVISLPAQTALQMTLISESRRATSSGLNQAARLLASAIATYSGGTLMALGPLALPFALAAGFTYFNTGVYYYYFASIPEANKA